MEAIPLTGPCGTSDNPLPSFDIPDHWFPLGGASTGDSPPLWACTLLHALPSASQTSGRIFHTRVGAAHHHG